MAIACCAPSVALAVDPPDLFYDSAHIAEFLWTGTGDGVTWQQAGNWTAPTFPGGYPYSIPTYPNDPDRIDTVETEIWPVVGANLSTNLGSDLTVDINASDVTVASLKLGGTGTAVTTSITSSTSNLLVFEHGELTDNVTNPGDPGDPPDVPEIFPEPIYSFNDGHALIWSTGTEGVGKVNRIDADIKLNGNVDVEGDRDLHIYGDIIEGDRNNANAVGIETSLSSLLSNGKWLYLHGNIQTTFLDDELGTPGTQERAFRLNSARGDVIPADPQMPPLDQNEVNRTGQVDFSGQFIGVGWVEIGHSDNGDALPLSTVVLRGDSVGVDPENPVFSGEIAVNRGNVVLGHDNALGGGNFKTGSPNGFGFNFVSDNDNRNIATSLQISQWQTVRGAEDIAGLVALGNHSIEFSGPVIQTTSRGWVNILPYDHVAQTGQTLTISGPQYPLQGGNNADPDRIYTIDGTGRTLITGGIHDFAPDSAITNGRRGHFRKRGAGTVVIDYDETNTTDTPTDHAGWAWIEGGNLHYADNSDLPVGTILSRGGAVGVDDTTEGVVGNTTFLQKLNNSQNPNQPTSPPWFNVHSANRQQFTTFSSGGLMLAPDEYGEDLDFTGTQANNSLARAANMSLAAHESGSVYTGIITPANLFNSSSPAQGGIRTNAETYMLGGGSGTLTLPNDNQLVNGAAVRGLLVTNGGEVVLEGTNTYTGTTRVVGKYLPSNTESAIANIAKADVDLEDNLGDASDTYLSSKLTVKNFADGSSSIGNSTVSDPANLVIQGSTLQYKGAGAVSTNRLFTIGTAGATIEAPSDAGVLTFASSSALEIDVAEPRAAVVSTQLTGGAAAQNKIFGRHAASDLVQFNTEDLVPGMRITGTSGSTPGTVGWVDGLAITRVEEVDVVEVGGEGFVGWNIVASQIRTINFGPAPARFLTLTGSNSGDNTFNPSIGDAPDVGNATVQEAAAGFGTVGIRKRGAGKWILTNDNTYSGATNIEEGTLMINGTHSGAGLTTVSVGATLGGTGSMTGDLINNGTFAPGASIGTFSVTGNVTMGLDSHFAVEILGSTSDLLAVTGDIDLTALENALDVTTLGALSGTSWVIGSYTGTLTGEFETVTPGFTVDYGSLTNDVITLIFDETIIPEPSSLLLSGLAILALFGIGRRRNK